jgi:hypothetical protein
MWRASGGAKGSDDNSLTLPFGSGSLADANGLDWQDGKKGKRSGGRK